jgi:tRNA(fMet)-specific endonuclease VapC
VKYLLDSDWVISFLNGRPAAVTLVSRLADSGLAMTIITYGEIYEGFQRGLLNEEALDRFERFAATLDLLSPNLDAARFYGQCRAQLRAQGLLVPDNDLWTAAIALAHDLTLVSRDRHFARIANLKLYQDSGT